MFGIGDRLMFRPGSAVVGDQGAVAPDPHPDHVGGDLDPPANHRRVHSRPARAVVAASWIAVKSMSFCDGHKKMG